MFGISQHFYEKKICFHLIDVKARGPQPCGRTAHGDVRTHGESPEAVLAEAQVADRGPVHPLSPCSGHFFDFQRRNSSAFGRKNWLHI